MNIFLIFSIFAAVSIGFAKPQNYTFAVMPQYAVTTVHKEWQPIVTHLEKMLGIKLTIMLYSDFGKFEADLFSGKLDFCYMNPYQMVRAHMSIGFEPLIVSSDEKLFSIIVVPIKSNIKTISELKNKVIAAPSPHAYGATILVDILLTAAKIPYTSIYFGSYDNAYRAVLYGKTSAAGGSNKTLIKQPIEIQNQLRIISTVPSYTGHPLGAGKNVSHDLKKRVTEELIRYSLTKEGESLLTNVGLRKPVAATYKKDYKNTEKNLAKYLLLHK